ncbi:NADPH:quinone reductase-like Zn-dependent oxidoreductase [Mucilaginibacter frigoritolerans]|uniref:NADPH:quinone reductase-like Zn-dependent oxidoreductase n=1 Tax=Mucilaginibacter frigoritolerans TaxID=652788 RepID=A0A562U5Q9_9SPHI|nr:Zn-dependent oxidoreductase [Mucilaginibacter frigoritolerans]TWJ00657.1 NADPH:quinone reductase-like Zn-dependent oxidoreductase [Mucilaginibacter frigoritolerans]
MNELMKAIVLMDDVLTVQNVKKPTKVEPGHLIIKMDSSAINSGDKFFLKHPTPPGAVKSLFDIKGVSGAGEVLQAGEGVPKEYLGKNVTFYRQLRFSESVVGSWSEYTHVHFLDCAILPDGADPTEYSGSMVNIITPLAFLKQIINEGHKGIISTAGNSATGIALLGFCLTYNFPLICIVRTEQGKEELEGLGTKNIIVQSDPDFSTQLTDMAQTLNTTAIFDGVGGDILNKILPSILRNSVIYSYGYIGDAVPFTFHTSVLALKNIIIRPFSNYNTETVKNPENLEKAVKEISELIHLPHFKTKIGKRFRLEEIEDALAYSGGNGKKPVLYHI